ncbi:MAG: hypothetical protein OEY23_00310 [Acidimicrobiia bacterium]|nr:hypothetical protein [Acidimicrobiia bacterium]
MNERCRRGGRRRWASAGLVLLALVAALVSGVVAPGGNRVARADTGANWWNTPWGFRVRVSVTGNGFARTEPPLEATIDFTTLFAQAGSPGAFDPNSVRVLEVDGAGAVVGSPLPAQFDPGPGYDASTAATGNVVFVAPGALGAAQTRSFDVYFDHPAAGIPAQSQSSLVALTDGVPDAGQDAYRLVTPGGTWYYQKTGSAFSSLVDSNGADWIGYAPGVGTGSNGEYRGVPNLTDDWFHPGGQLASSTIVRNGPVKVTIESTSNNGWWRIRHEVFPRFVRSTVSQGPTPAGSPGFFWWLYEGTPGGGINTAAGKQDIVRSNGARTAITAPWDTPLSPEEWAFFTNNDTNRSLFMAHHEDDSSATSYYLQDNAMTVFGFGRGANGGITQLPAHFTTGLIETTDTDGGAAAVRGAYKPLAVTVGAVQTAPVGGPPPPAMQGYGFAPVVPSRLLDTRDVDRLPFGARVTRNLAVTGRGGVPADAYAVALNVTIVDASEPTYLTVWATGTTKPPTSSVNSDGGGIVPNQVTTVLGSGQVSIYNNAGEADVVVDVVGYYGGTGASGGYHPVTPVRALDTREPPATVAAGGTVDVDVAAALGVPAANMRAAVLNVTAVASTGDGYLTVYPPASERPLASALNFTAGQIVPNTVISKVDASGKVRVYNHGGATDVVVDVMGWFDAGAQEGLAFHPVTPARVHDTREGAGAIPAATVRTNRLTGVAEISASAKAVLVNVTVTRPTDFGYVTVYPAGAARPLASLHNPCPGCERANQTVVTVSATGDLSAYNHAGFVDLVFDVAGWFG